MMRFHEKKRENFYFFRKSQFHVHNNRVSTKKHIPTLKQKISMGGSGLVFNIEAISQDICTTLEMTMIYMYDQKPQNLFQHSATKT